VDVIDRSRALTIGVTLPFNDHQASYADLPRAAQAVERIDGTMSSTSLTCGIYSQTPHARPNVGD
jgi:hypothetical protein